jgi:hypothetical protein
VTQSWLVAGVTAAVPRRAQGHYCDAQRIHPHEAKSSEVRAMIIKTPDDVTTAVRAVMEQTQDRRLREIMVSLVRDLYAFVRDVRLTETEFRQATAIINKMGRLASDSHNETVLMASSVS